MPTPSPVIISLLAPFAAALTRPALAKLHVLVVGLSAGARPLERPPLGLALLRRAGARRQGLRAVGQGAAQPHRLVASAGEPPGAVGAAPADPAGGGWQLHGDRVGRALPGGR